VKTGIVGAGISGLATGHAILARDPAAEIVIFESRRKTGGKVMTEITPEGYLCEWGVNAFLDKSPPTLELCDEIGLPPVRANSAAKKRYVFSEGELHQLPEKPPQFLSSKLLSVPGRLRVLWEVFAGGTGVEDETLAEFGTRRLGREAFEKLIDPMASGVFAGDATKMSLKSCFPRIHEIEDEYGSLIRGLIKLQMEARKAGGKDMPGPGPGGMLTSFSGGMSALTDTLAAGFGDGLRTATPVRGVSRDNGRYNLHLENGSSEEFDVLILAAPAYAQASMLGDMAPEIAGLLMDIYYPPLSVVCLGYDRARIDTAMDGFGFLIPSREKRGILGTVADSNVFPDRAPEGSLLLRTMVGGARSPELAGLADEKLLDLVREDLQDIMGVDTEPEFAQIYRHERAIPQYLVGHGGRLAEIENHLKNYPGLVLTGNAFRGVSLNDCVLNASRTAQSVISWADGDGAIQP
jgi:oxygen-dependent protoporphyrinogen oxidase